MSVLSHSFQQHDARTFRSNVGPELRALTSDDLAGLQAVLSRTTRSDGYSRSASYYAMTGRKGLWLYSTGDTFMVIAAHPNRDNHLLLFPPMGKQPTRLLDRLVHDERIGAGHIQLARMAGQDQLILAWVEATGQFTPAPEELLDWKFPVHTLSTSQLIEHRGNRFRNFRKGIIHAERAGLTARLVENQKDRETVSGLAATWAGRIDHDGYSTDDLTAPTRATLDLMDKTDLALHGLIVQRDGEPVGFIIWEETHPEEGMANSMCGISIERNGTSEFVYLSMAQILADRGFAFICDGGSESEGLDAFKRKMNPVNSVPLQSAFSIRP